MARERVYISITYGSIDDAHLLNAVYVAMAKLKKLRIEPILMQVYMPGSKPRVSVNGVEVSIRADLADAIVSIALETLAQESFVRNKHYIEGRLAAAKQYG